jgi:transposase InsO family protein
VVELIKEASTAGARQSKACKVVGISSRTLQRWGEGEGDRVLADGRGAAAPRRHPRNKLSSLERQSVLDVANSQEFAHLAPNQIVPMLADQGRYIASESTFYRVLRDAGQMTHRGKVKPPTRKRPASLHADAPNQLWSWDITYLATTVKGIFFYLYLIMDIFSRKIVGWEIYETESAEQASRLFRKTCLREGIAGKDLVLHSDNGSPMKGATMLATLQKLGVMPSFSRPSVSNDNPYSEALFKTLKYHPGFPDKPFDCLESARVWVAGFQHWYNEVHRHSALKFVTPGQRHRGEDIVILEERQRLYEAAKAKQPGRWSRKTRDWTPVGTVYLNPGKPVKKEVELKQKAA